MGISRNIYLMTLFALQVTLLLYTLFFMKIRAEDHHHHHNNNNNEHFLENWVNLMKPVLYNETILDLSWPGSHDSLTSDLSKTFSVQSTMFFFFLSSEDSPFIIILVVVLVILPTAVPWW